MISIVTPSFNQGQFIEDTIRSVVCTQSNADFEYIVVDGSSTDETAEILERYASDIDHLIIEEDQGQADALAKGFRLAKGDILAYLNSDDVLLEGTLEWVTDYFNKHPHVDVIYSHRVFIDKQGYPIRFWILPPHVNYCMLRWDFIPQETCFWRRSVAEQHGGIDPSFRFAMDYDLFARYMPKVKFKRVNKFLAAFREHDSSKTSVLLETVGNQEIERVRCSHGITLRRRDKFIVRLWVFLIFATSRLLRDFLIQSSEKIHRLS